MTLPIAFAVAYLLGAIPTSYIVVYLFTGRDIRSIGNGNPGTMNVWDNVGAVPAVVVGLGDVGKGMAAVSVAYWLGFGDVVAISCGLLAVVGHDYSIFLHFHGGNGTAAAVGALFALVPEATMPAAAIAVGITVVTRSKRAGGLVGLLLVPALAAWQDYPNILVVGVIALLTVVALKIIRFEGFTPARTRPPR
ncbi:MAG: glycerol-3-phosphate acyltransferase [Dehalococcoidia bacterium]|nr:glycerol-3-phosphate acyltransferase [Dehalococcoidia bacterium]MCA9855963.1 glycerol-3-phosphate acyltransferase [Dehalococcoidia bacterium]MCB9483439.1 glycerol-3-phosphate acyltransferase [Dehalococcoidia bacterium]MCB9491556.1 glycerol-3-phosphate acyltransferase [Dehalococcoidia bacterium]